MIKLVICIPAYNEEKTVGLVIRSIPKDIPGIGALKVFVIDDGSTDGTAGEAGFAAEHAGFVTGNAGIAAGLSGPRAHRQWGR